MSPPLIPGGLGPPRAAASRLILAAHGAGDGSPANRAVRRLARLLTRRAGHPATAAFHLGTPSFAAMAGRVGDGDMVLPLLTSAGWFYRRLEQTLAARGAADRLLPALGTDPRLQAAILDLLCRRLDESALDPAEAHVVVVGHGTARATTSGVSTEALAAGIRRALPAASTESAFLDQDPSLQDVAAALRRSPRPVLVVVPFLLGGGGHARRDIDAALREVGKRRLDLPPLLALPALAELVGQIVRPADRRPTIEPTGLRRAA